MSSLSNIRYTLTPAQKLQYEEKGYLALSDVLTPEITKDVQTWTAEVKAWPHRKGEHMHYEEVRADGSRGHYRTESKLR
jgi:hypothetical protein